MGGGGLRFFHSFLLLHFAADEKERDNIIRERKKKEWQREREREREREKESQRKEKIYRRE